MVFASIRGHASTAIFLRARAEMKKIGLRAASSSESTTREHGAFFIFSACSNPYASPFLKIKKTEKKKKKQKMF